MLVTASDDSSVMAWSPEGQVQGKVVSVDYNITAMSWQPRAHSSSGELAAVGASDGAF